jgi:hypothetical protein
METRINTQKIRRMVGEYARDSASRQAQEADVIPREP